MENKKSTQNKKEKNIILGVHVSQKSKVLDNKKIARSMSSAISRDVNSLDINAVQIFTNGPYSLSENNIDYDEVNLVCKNICLVVHAPYLSVELWKIDNKNYNTSSSKAKITRFKKQLDRCKEIGAYGIVLHITRVPPKNVAFVMQLLKQHAKETKVKILLEMIASHSDPKLTYETPKKMDYLIETIGPNETYYGMTIDTAHIWAANVDIVNYDSMKEWFETCKHKNKIELFHLNGSSAQIGSGHDKHEIIFSFKDKIWKNVSPLKSGVRAVIEFSKKHSVPIICEINRGKESTVKKSLEIIKKIYKRVKV